LLWQKQPNLWTEKKTVYIGVIRFWSFLVQILKPSEFCCWWDWGYAMAAGITAVLP
jgi:hypothetical protein